MVSSASIAEAPPRIGENAGTAAVFTVTLTGSLSGPITVGLNASSGNATGGVDYAGSIPSTVTFAPGGPTSVQFSITPTNDALDEANEVVSVGLVAGGSYAVGAPPRATVTIVDDDGTTGGGGEINVTAPATVPEGGTASVTVSTGASDFASYWFDWNGDGSSTANELSDSPVAPVPAALISDGPFTRVFAAGYVDQGGNHYSQPVSIAVQNVAPTPIINGIPTSLTPGQSVTLTASATDPSLPDTVAGFTGHAWTITLGGQTVATGSGPSITFTPTQATGYFVTLTLEDQDGAPATSPTTSMPANRAPDGSDDASAHVDWNVVDQTNTLVIGFAGHTQNRSEAEADVGTDGFWHPYRGAGVRRLGERMTTSNIPSIKKGNVIMIAEDPENDRPLNIAENEHCGDGVGGIDRDGDGMTLVTGPDGKPQRDGNDVVGAFEAVVKAVELLGVRTLVIFGYSHGASTARLLTARLAADATLDNNVTIGGWLALKGVTIKFTGYIDGVRIERANEAFPGNEDPLDVTNLLGTTPGSKNDNDVIEWDEPEYRFPYKTQYHVNAYQVDETESGNAGFRDLAGGPLNRSLFQPTGYPDDKAVVPPIFAEVNVENPTVGNPDPNNIGAPRPHVEGTDHSEGGSTNEGIDDDEAVFAWVIKHLQAAFS